MTHNEKLCAKCGWVESCHKDPVPENFSPDHLFMTPHIPQTVEDRFNEKFPEIGHKHDENCEWVCHFRGDILSFIQEVEKEAYEKGLREALLKEDLSGYKKVISAIEKKIVDIRKEEREKLLKEIGDKKKTGYGDEVKKWNDMLSDLQATLREEV